MNIDEWEAKYIPIKNHLVEENEQAFETYGIELEFVRSQPDNKVWTEVDGDDDNTYLVNGYHHVNRIRYFVCQVPHEGEPVEIKCFDGSDIEQGKL